MCGMFFSNFLINNEASLTVNIGALEIIFWMYSLRKRKQSWRREKIILAKSKKQDLSFSLPSPYLRGLEMNG